MPIRCSRGQPRYRVRKISRGRKQRLVFCGSKVVEAKTLKKKR